MLFVGSMEQGYCALSIQEKKTSNVVVDPLMEYHYDSLSEDVDMGEDKEKGCDCPQKTKSTSDQKKQKNDIWDVIPAVLQFIAVGIAVGALILNKKHIKESNDQSIKTYKSFIYKSDRQFHAQQQTIKAQQQTINAIREQSLHLEKKDQQIEMKNSFSICYSSIWTIREYVDDHFWDFLKGSDVFIAFLKEMLHPFVKAALVLQLMPQDNYGDGFDAILDRCVHLREIKVDCLDDMDALVKDLEDISTGLDNQKVFFENVNR